MYSTRKILPRKEHSFCLFQNICKLPISISSFFIYYLNSAFPGISNSKRPNLMLPFLQNLFIKVYLSVPPNCFHRSNQFYWSVCTIFMLSQIMEFFDRCFFLLVCGCFCCYCLFSFWFPFLAKILSLAVKMQPVRQPLLN